MTKAGVVLAVALAAVGVSSGPTITGSPGGVPAAMRGDPGGATPAMTGDPVIARTGNLLLFERTSVQSRPKGAGDRLNVAVQGRPRPAAGHLSAPLATLVPTSPFGLRVSPITGQPGEFHWGQDFAAPCGTLVYAADSGVVRQAGWFPLGGGNRIEIDHGNGLITTYNHLQGIAVNRGDSVQVGQVIGKIGTTGWSTGCHLHFETIRNGTYVDPMGWILDPISQEAPLETITFTDYSTADPLLAGWSVPVGGGTPAPGTPGYISPESEKDGAVPPTPSPSATPSPSVTPSPSSTPLPSSAPQPSGTPTQPPVTPSSPPPSPTSSPTPTVTTPPAEPPPPSPSPSPSPSSSSASAPAPSPSPSSTAPSPTSSSSTPGP